MHAGQALWLLYGGLVMLERYHATDRRLTALVADMFACAREIGKFIRVPEPSDADLGDILDELRKKLPEVSDEQPSDSRPEHTTSESRHYDDPEVVQAARKLLDEMTSSGLFEWSGFIDDISSQMQSAGAFFTYKQARAVRNTARRGVYEDGVPFWDRFEDEYPEAAGLIEEWADNA